VQSALLEAMEEHQVTIGNESLLLPEPFFVIATQNPLEHNGTYPLPEAELDRFFMKVCISYPDKDAEKEILQEPSHSEKILNKSPLTEKEFLEIQKFIEEQIHIDEHIYTYVTNILDRSRHPGGSIDGLLEYGASTRAGLALIRGSRIHALLE
jgi:MoxR-like ATPase